MRLELDLYFLWQIHALNLKFIFKDSSKTPENWLLAKGNNFQKLQLYLYYVMTNSCTKFQVLISRRRQIPIRKTEFKQRTIILVKVDPAWRNPNLSSLMFKQIHVPNFKSIERFSRPTCTRTCTCTRGFPPEICVWRHHFVWCTSFYTSQQTCDLLCTRK